MFKKLLIATLMLSPLTGYARETSDKELAAHIETLVQPIAKEAIGNKKIIAVVNQKKRTQYISIRNGSCNDYDRLHGAIINTAIRHPDILGEEIGQYLGFMTFKGAAKLNCAFAKEFK